MSDADTTKMPTFSLPFLCVFQYNAEPCEEPNAACWQWKKSGIVKFFSFTFVIFIFLCSSIPRCALTSSGFKQNATKEYFGILWRKQGILFLCFHPSSPLFSCAGEWLRNRERPLQCDPVPCCSLLSGDGQGPGWTHERMWQVHGATRDLDTCSFSAQRWYSSF